MVLRESVRFVAEQDSLNASMLGPDAAPGTPEFDLFVKEVVDEMTVKAGQKCTAIRRAMAPAAVSRRGRGTRSASGWRRPGRRPARRGQPDGRAGQLRPARRRPRPDRQAGRRRARGSSPATPMPSVGPEGGAFMQPILLRADDPWHSERGPRCRGVRAGLHDHALPRPRRRRSRSPIAAWAAWRCRCSPIRPTPRATSSRAPPPFTAGCWSSTATMPRNCTGHGIPLPVLVHGGPGRAGGSEEMGGIRGVKHYMQRTAIQSTPAMIAAITEQYIPGGPKHFIDGHPFRKRMSELAHRRHAQDRQPHRDDRRHRAFRRIHRRQFLRPYGRGSGQGLADLRRPGRARLSDPELRRGPVRRSRSRARCWPIPASRICAS